MPTNLSRREALLMMGTLAGAAAIPSAAFGASSKITVGTWGGAFQELLAGTINPLLAEHDVEIVFDIAMQGDRKTKLLAERRLASGSLDIVLLADNDMYEMELAGGLAPIGPESVPEMANLYPEFKKSYAVPQIYSGLVIVYRSDLLPTAPRSYADLWAPEIAGRIGLSDSQFVQNIIAASQAAAGGKASDYEAGKQKLLELKKAGAKVYTGLDQLAQGLKSGEVAATIVWRGRAAQWREAGIPVENVGASEGILPVTFEIGIPANAPNPQGAAKFIAGALSPDAQLAFAKQFGYAPTVVNSGVSEEVLSTRGFSEAERANFFVPDIGFIAKNTPEWSEWWQTVFLG